MLKNTIEVGLGLVRTSGKPSDASRKDKEQDKCMELILRSFWPWNVHFPRWPSTDCSSMSFCIPVLNPCKYLPSDPAHDRSTANYPLWEETNSLVCSEPATPQFWVELSRSCVRSDIETSHPSSLPQTAQHFSCLFLRPLGLLCSRTMSCFLNIFAELMLLIGRDLWSLRSSLALGGGWWATLDEGNHGFALAHLGKIPSPPIHLCSVNISQEMLVS